MIYEGANALAASCNDTEAFTDARQAVRTLLDAGLDRHAQRVNVSMTAGIFGYSA